MVEGLHTNGSNICSADAATWLLLLGGVNILVLVGGRYVNQQQQQQQRAPIVDPLTIQVGICQTSPHHLMHHSGSRLISVIIVI